MKLLRRKAAADLLGVSVRKFNQIAKLPGFPNAYCYASGGWRLWDEGELLVWKEGSRIDNAVAGSKTVTFMGALPGDVVDVIARSCAAMIEAFGGSFAPKDERQKLTVARALNTLRYASKAVQRVSNIDTNASICDAVALWNAGLFPPEDKARKNTLENLKTVLECVTRNRRGTVEAAQKTMIPA